VRRTPYLRVPVPTFCRHNRLLQNCPICTREQAATAPPPPPRRRPATGSARPKPGAPTTTRRRGSAVRVRREVRGPQDDYASPLLPGVRSSVDAGKLASELAFAAGRLARLFEDPPGLYAEAALADDRADALELIFLVAYLQPAETEDPFAGIAAARAGAALDEVPLGPRTAHEAGRGDGTLEAYRAWAGRSGGLAAAWAGEASWTPARRFARLWERLALPGLQRSARFDLLATAGALGLVELVPDGLRLQGEDAAVSGAKRAFGIGDPILLDRRAAALAEAAEVPLAALDLALWNWETPGRAHGGVPADVEDLEVRARIEGALGL
jgi:hypothetical protein